MSAVFAQFLEDFSGSDASVSLPAIANNLDEPAPASAITEADVELAKAQAFQEGSTTTRAELEAQFEAQFRSQQQEHEAQMKQAHNEMSLNIAQKLSSDLNNQAMQFADNIRRDIVGILSQLIDQHIVDQSVDELMNVMMQTLANEQTIAIKLSGPQDLLAKIGEKLGEKISQVEVVENDQVELSLSFDDQILSTKINDWRAQIGVGAE